MHTLMIRSKEVSTLFLCCNRCCQRVEADSIESCSNNSKYDRQRSLAWPTIHELTPDTMGKWLLKQSSNQYILVPNRFARAASNRSRNYGKTTTISNVLGLRPQGPAKSPVLTHPLQSCLHRLPPNYRIGGTALNQFSTLLISWYFPCASRLGLVIQIAPRLAHLKSLQRVAVCSRLFSGRTCI